MEPPSDTHEGQRQRDNSNTDAPHQPDVVPPANPPKRENTAPPGTNEPDKRKPSYARWTHPQVVVNGTLALMGGIGLWIYYCQLVEMQKASKAATESLDLTRKSITQSEGSTRFDQRAWVAAENFSGAAEPDQPFITKVRITNTGKTFARDTEIHYRADIVRKNDPPPLGLLSSGYAGTERSVVLLPPSGGFEAVCKIWNGKKLTQPQIDALISEEVVLFLSGKITYTDVFGCKHWTTYCSRYNALDKTYIIYDKHNEAGDEPCK